MSITFTREISYDRETRDFALTLNGELVGFARSYADGERVLDELVYAKLTKMGQAPEPNALGEPMPASADEALARQLVGELSEMEALGQLDGSPDLLRRYDAKSAQVRALGYEVGPDGAGGLCLWRGDNSGPLHPAGEPGAGHELAAANAEIAAAVAGFEPDAEEQAEFYAWVAELEAEAEAAVSYTLPDAPLVAEALAELARVAQQAGDRVAVSAFAKAEHQLAAGAYAGVAVAADGALLIPSRTAAGAVYRVGAAGCSCPAAAHGRPCWHDALAEGVALAREWAAAELDDRATYGRMAA